MAILIIEGLIVPSFILAIIYFLLFIYGCFKLYKLHKQSSGLNTKKLFVMNCVLASILRFLSFSSMCIFNYLEVSITLDDSLTSSISTSLLSSSSFKNGKSNFVSVIRNHSRQLSPSSSMSFSHSSSSPSTSSSSTLSSLIYSVIHHLSTSSAHSSNPVTDSPAATATATATGGGVTTLEIEELFYKASLVQFDLPDFCFVSAYVLLLVVWAEAILQSRRHWLASASIRRVWILGYIAFNTLLYTIQVSLYSLLFSPQVNQRILGGLIYLTLTVISLGVPSFWICCYLYLTFIVSGFPFISHEARQRLRRLACLGSFWTATRLVWGTVALTSVLNDWLFDQMLTEQVYVITLMAVFLVCEVLPLSLSLRTAALSNLVVGVQPSAADDGDADGGNESGFEDDDYSDGGTSSSYYQYQFYDTMSPSEISSPTATATAAAAKSSAYAYAAGAGTGTGTGTAGARRGTRGGGGEGIAGVAITGVTAAAIAAAGKDGKGKVVSRQKRILSSASMISSIADADADAVDDYLHLLEGNGNGNGSVHHEQQQECQQQQQQQQPDDYQYAFDPLLANSSSNIVTKRPISLSISSDFYPHLTTRRQQQQQGVGIGTGSGSGSGTGGHSPTLPPLTAAGSRRSSISSSTGYRLGSGGTGGSRYNRSPYRESQRSLRSLGSEFDNDPERLSLAHSNALTAASSQGGQGWSLLKFWTSM